MIKAVLFDADGVLIDSFAANLKFHQDLMTHVGHKGPTEEEYRKHFFHSTLLSNIKNITKIESDEEVKKIWKMGRDRVVPFPAELVSMPENAAKTIKKLSEKYTLGIVSSKLRQTMREITVIGKLAKYFKVMVWYEDTINHKPHPEPLLLAVSKLNIEPYEAVYVGDGMGDVQAAKEAGMKSIAYSKPLDGADAFVSSFEELPNAILKL